MIKQLKQCSKEQKVYLLWITSLLLGYYAWQQPFNKLLSLIRQNGIVSISLSSILENKQLVMHAIMPTILIWILIFAIWFVLFIVGINKENKILSKWLEKIVGDENILDALFYIGMWIEIIWASLYYATFHMPFATVLVFIAMQCFAVRIILAEHTKKEWMWIGVLVTLGVACEFYTTRGFVLRAVLLILSSKGIECKRVLKYYLIANVVSCLAIITISGLGITGTWIEKDAYRAVDEVQNRYVLGFNSPNTTHYVLIRLALVAMYIWWDKLKLWHIITIFGVNYALYTLTDSRTGFMVGLVACMLSVFFLYFKKIRDWKLWYYLAMVLIVVLAVFSLHFLQWNFYQYDTTHECPEYVYKVNDLLVGRIHQALKFTQDIEFSPIGTRQSGVYCDMGYIKFFLQEGYLIYGIYLLVIVKLLLWQHKTRDYAGYIIIVAISLRMFMESSFVPFVFQNVILLLLVGKWSELMKPLKDRKA